MIIIHLYNAKTKLQLENDAILKVIADTLTYYDQNAEYAYQKHLRQLQRINALYKRAKSEAEKERYQGQLRRYNFLVDKHDRERRICLLDDDGNFPTGLLNKVLDVLDKCEVFWEIKDHRKKDFPVKELKLKKPLFKLRHYQEDAVRLAAGEGRGIIVSPTGSGKTAIILDLIRHLKTKTIVVTPSKSITDNMYDALMTYYGKTNVEKITKTSKNQKPIGVVNIQSLIKLDPKKLESYNAVIIDEFHHAGSTSYTTVNELHLASCYYRIGLTATNFRNAGDDLALEGVLSNVIYTYEIKDAIEEGFLTKPVFRWLNAPGAKKANYQTEYKKSIVENKKRNQMIADTCKANRGKSILVLVQQIEHGTRIQELMPEATFLSGKEGDEERQDILEAFRQGDIKVLVGTGVIGEGVDLPRAEVLIMAGGGKSKSQVMQNVGRVLRLFPGKEQALIFDFEDKGTKYLEGHALERAKIYEEEYIY